MAERAESAKVVKKPSRLGRGLSSLMATPVAVAPPVADRSESVPTEPSSAEVERVESPAVPEGFRWVAVDAIQPNRHQPRQFFDAPALQRLADSIRAEGMMQPVVVRPAEQAGRFELVAGERRWRAAKLAGLDRIPALSRVLDDRQLAEWALIENLQREDLNPIERAEAFERLGTAFGLGHDEIAGRVGLERSTVTNLLRLLKLADPVREHVSRGTLSMGQARSLAGVEDSTGQISLAEQCIKEGWSVRQVEAAVRSQTSGAGGAAPVVHPKIIKSAHLADLEKQISEHLQTKVALRGGRKKGAGTLTISFYSIDQFDSILSSLGVSPQ